MKRYVQDKSYPLEERWKFFIKHKLGDTISVYKLDLIPGMTEELGHIGNYLNDRMYYSLDAATVNVKKVLHFTYGISEKQIIYNKDLFKEWCLQNYIRKFKIDW